MGGQVSPGVSENRCHKVKGHKPPLQQRFDSISSDENIHLLSIGLAVMKTHVIFPVNIHVFR